MKPNNTQIILGTASEYEGRTYHQYTDYGCTRCDNELRAEYNPPFYTKIKDTNELLCPNCALKLDKWLLILPLNSAYPNNVDTDNILRRMCKNLI